VLGQQSGIDGAAAPLACWLLRWLWRLTPRGGTRNHFATRHAPVGSTWAIGVNVLAAGPPRPRRRRPTAGKPGNPGRVINAQGQSVFVDFTA
jgi:hypothetical protein